MCVKTQNIYFQISEERVVIGKKSKLNPFLSKDPPREDGLSKDKPR